MVKSIKIRNLFLPFLKLGLTAFGGPAMVAYVRELVVEKRKWLDNKTFQEGIALAQAIPGATVMQVVAYAGFKIRGIVGGLVSFIAFGLPAFLLMLFLSYIYAKTHNLPEVISIFAGLQVIVVAIVANAFLSFAKPIIKSVGEIIIAIFSFLLFLFKISPFLIIIACFLISQIIFKDTSDHKVQNSKNFNFVDILILILILFTGLIFLYFWDKILFKLSLIMMKIDLFAFGGGYASVPLMLHEIVDRLHWLDSKTFMDGIALGQITPGPIVITATFVGYLLKGLLGATLATISVFTPSFIIMAFASEISEKIRNLQIFLRAKKGLLASFSGLLFFATFKFATSVEWNFLKLTIALASFLALYKRINILYVVLVGALISAIIFK